MDNEGGFTATHMGFGPYELQGYHTWDIFIDLWFNDDLPPISPFSQVTNRPSLINYNPVADNSAVVVSPDGMARFTVLTPRLIRMEYAHAHGVFEDRSTIAVSGYAGSADSRSEWLAVADSRRCEWLAVLTVAVSGWQCWQSL